MNRRRLMFGRKVDDSPAVLIDGVYSWTGGAVLGYTSSVIDGLVHLNNLSGHINLPTSKTIKIKSDDTVSISFVKQSGPQWSMAYFDIYFNDYSQLILENKFVNVSPNTDFNFTATRDYSVDSIGLTKRTGNPPNYSPDFVMAIHITVNGTQV